MSSTAAPLILKREDKTLGPAERRQLRLIGQHPGLWVAGKRCDRIRDLVGYQQPPFGPIERDMPWGITTAGAAPYEVELSPVR